MKRQAQRGMLLLPVALVLAITGALAYTMTREGGMGVSAIDAEYDTEVARYLAEAGMNLAKWQNQKRGCGQSRGFDTVTLPGGTITARNGDIQSEDDDTLRVAVAAATASGAAQRLERRGIVMHDLRSDKAITLDASDGAIDTSIREGSGAQAQAAYLELSDHKAHGLIRFPTSLVPQGALVTFAELKLYHAGSDSTQSPRSLAVHRVTRDWSGTATWTSPWSATPGGAYAPQAVATVQIEGNRLYALRIDTLVQDWVDGTLSDHGLLLKPSGLLEARFASFEAAANRPQLLVRYYPRCT